MVHFVFNFLIFFILFIVLINPLVVVSVFGLNFDGQVLISLLKNWNVSEEIKSSWNASDSTPCNWMGIQCNHPNHSAVVSLNLSNYHIYGGLLGAQIGKLRFLNEISMRNTSLSGRIPKELGNCRGLTRIDLFTNKLEGGIPIELRMLRKLQLLDLSNNNLTGEIPKEITELHELRYLILFMNRFTGAVPKTLGINSSLVNVDLCNNKFSGEIPPNLSYRRQLSNLNLGLNNFQGVIPPFSGAQNLMMLDLNGNFIEGQVPRSLVDCKALRYLDVGNNQINDTFPFWLGSLPNLEFLSLRSNRFHGPIINFERQIAPNILKIIDFSYNYLSGELPSQYFSQLDGLMNSSLNFNASTSKYASYYKVELKVIYKRRVLDLNKLVTEFRAIDFSHNQFQGRIPESMGKLKLLKSLNLSNNNFSDNIPSSLGNLIQLESLDLFENKLTGEIPLQLTKLNSLAILNLSKNLLTGPIPEVGQFHTFGEDSFMGNLGLCGNQLTKKSCGNSDDHPTTSEAPRTEQSHMDSIFNKGFGWEPVLIGYSCGLVVVFFTQTIIFGWNYSKRKG